MKTSNYWGSHTWRKWRGRALTMAFGHARHPSRAAARKAYAALGYRGRVVLDRPKMKRRGRKFAPPKCKTCGDTGVVMGWHMTWDGPDQYDEPCGECPRVG